MCIDSMYLSWKRLVDDHDYVEKSVKELNRQKFVYIRDEQVGIHCWSN